MKSRILFFALLITKTFAFWDYDDVFPCTKVVNAEYEDNVLDHMNLHGLDAAFFITFGIIAWFLSLFIVLTFIRYKPLRKSPGDIIFAISFSELVLTTHWIATTIFYYSHNDDAPQTEGKFCQTNAVFSILAGFYEFAYNCFFCIFLFMKIRNKFRPSKIPTSLLHLIIISLGIVFLLIMFFMNNVGKSILGTCSVKATSKFPLFGPILVLIYCFLAMGTVVYFKKNIPNTSDGNQIERRFMDYYFSYTRSCLIIWSIQCIFYFLVILNCSYFKSQSLLIFYSFTNIVKLASPFILCIIRIRDPFLQYTLRKHWKSIRKRLTSNPISSRNSSIFSGQHVLETITDNIKKIIASLMTSGALYLVTHQDQGNLIYDEVSGLYETQFTILIDENFLKTYLTNLPFPEREGFKGKLTFHSPNIFQEIQFNDLTKPKFDQSLDPYNNRNGIAKASGADGGRGGELFVFSFDNKLILKTMTESEFIQFKGLLPQYKDHLDKYPFSLLTRVYGLFTLESDEQDDKIRFFLMKNIVGVDSSRILRKYDMKGSTADREVLKKDPTAIDKGRTLKDTDFLKVEGKLHVTSFVSGWMEQSARLDAGFLRDQGLIDYSLFVVVIRIANNEMNLLDSSFIPKVNEPNAYYKIGIIDFLQLFNFMKKVEKATKQIQYFDPKRDVSSQDPVRYAERFEKFMIRILNEEYDGRASSGRESIEKSKLEIDLR